MAKQILSTMCGPRPLVAKTCLGCGEIKNGSEFQRYNRKEGRYAHSYCLTCQHTISADINREHQNHSLETATKRWEEWTDREILELEEMWKARVPNVEIARITHRTVLGVAAAKNRYGMGRYRGDEDDEW